MGLGHAERLCERIRLEVVARVRSPDVRADGAREALGIGRVSERVLVGERRIVAIGDERERRAARPPAHTLRRDSDHLVVRLLSAPPFCLEPHEAPKGGHVLLELPVDHEGSVGAEIPEGAAGLERAKHFFSVERHAARIQDVYDEILGPDEG